MLVSRQKLVVVISPPISWIILELHHFWVSPGFESDRRTEISSYGLRDLNQFYHIGTHNTAGEMITPA